MGKHEAISAAVDDETFADLQKLAEHMNCSVDHLVATAVYRFVNDEIRAIAPDQFADIPGYRDPELDWAAIDTAQASFNAFLQRGIDDLEAGRTIPHEEVMREMRERAAGRQAAE